MSFEFDVRGLEEQLGRLKNYDEIANRNLRKAMQSSLITIQGNVMPLVPVFQARLKNSLGSNIIEITPTELTGIFGTSLKDEIYPSVMEYGREPGTMPPPESLLRWVHLKIRPGEANEMSVAWAIAIKIKRSGIKGKKFMETGFKKSRESIERYFKQAADQTAEDLTNGR